MDPLLPALAATFLLSGMMLATQALFVLSLSMHHRPQIMDVSQRKARLLAEHVTILTQFFAEMSQLEKGIQVNF